jgi:hypothetical protein
MFQHQDREALRRFYFTAWDKARRGAPLEPLERQLAELIGEHPEYHAMLERPDTLLDRDFGPEGGETNPFLHLGLHMAIREQVGTDRPPGIRAAFNALLSRCGERLEAEHLAIECLAESLWQASRDGAPPDEAAYLACLRGRSPTGR